jgi:hypothetical protein
MKKEGSQSSWHRLIVRRQLRLRPHLHLHLHLHLLQHPLSLLLQQRNP